MVREPVIVGDVHGCIRELNKLLDLISYDPRAHRLIFAGDVVDRGNDPIACVRRVRELGAECVMGNHEHKHIRQRRYIEAQKAGGKKNPMRPLDAKTRQENEALTEEDLLWMQSLPVTLHVQDNWHVIHGGLEPAYSFQNQHKDKILRTRYVSEEGKSLPLRPDKSQPINSKYWAEIWNGPESIIYGHCVHSLTEPRIDLRPDGVECIGIDTGCCFGGRLTALFLNTKEFVQVQAEEAYSTLFREE